MAAIVVECYRHAAAVVASWVFGRRDCVALEWDVASCSFPYPWSEGREECVMD
jgi:hypothetical protein